MGHVVGRTDSLRHGRCTLPVLRHPGDRARRAQRAPQAPRLLDGLDRPAPHWTSWVRIGAGLLFIAAGIWYRLKPERTIDAPQWVSRIKSITPAGAAAVGVALTVVN